MNFPKLLSALAIVISLYACQSADKPAEVREDLPTAALAVGDGLPVSGYVVKNGNTEGIPSDPKSIDNEIQDMETTEEGREVKGPLTLERGGQQFSVYAHFAYGTPYKMQVVSVDNALEQRYFIFMNRILKMEEIGQLTDGTYFESKFYYSPTAYIKGEIRMAPSREELANASFEEYTKPYGEEDYRMSVVGASRAAFGFLQGN